MDSGEVAEEERGNMTDVVAALPDVLPSENLIDRRVLDNTGFNSLTSVQRNIISAVQSNRNVLIYAPSGSGKTSGYLMTIISKILKDCDIGHGDPESCVVSPSVLILTNNMEAVTKVYNLCADLCADTPISCAYISDGIVIAENIKNVEVVIAPGVGKFFNLLRNSELKMCMDKLKFIVLDNAAEMYCFFGPADFFSKLFPNIDGIQFVLAASKVNSHVNNMLGTFGGQKFMVCSDHRLEEISRLEFGK